MLMGRNSQSAPAAAAKSNPFLPASNTTRPPAKADVTAGSNRNERSDQPNRSTSRYVAYGNAGG